MGVFADFKEKNKETSTTTSEPVLSFGSFKKDSGFTSTQTTPSFTLNKPEGDGFLHHAARNNNPGNLKFAGQPGAQRAPDSDFAQFPTIQAGFEAMKRDVLAKMEGRSTAEAAKKINLGLNSSIYDLISVYAPPHENETMKYAKNVAEWLGVDVNTKLKDVRHRIDEFAKAMVFNEDKDAFAMLTGAKTANANEKVEPEKEVGAFGQFKQERDAEMTKSSMMLNSIMQDGRAVLTDVLGSGLVFGSSAKKVDPTLPTPDQMSDTANSTKMFVTPEEVDEKSILPRSVRDARSIIFNSLISDTYLSVMNTLFTGVRAVTESAIEIKGKDGGFMSNFEKALDEKVNIPLSEEMKKQIELAGGMMTSNAMQWSDGKEGISSWRETLYSWGNTFGSMGVAMGLWATTRSTRVAAGFLTAMESSNVYNEARDAGKSPHEAMRIAAASGAGTYLLEKWGITVMGGLAGSKTLSQWVINGAKAGLAETGQEELQTIWQNTVKKHGYDQSQEYLEGWFDTAVATFVPSMLMNMALPSATGAVGRSDILKDIQDKAGVDQDTADRAWNVMQYATEDFFNSLQLRGLQVEDVSGGKASVDTETNTDTQTPEPAYNTDEVVSDLRDKQEREAVIREVEAIGDDALIQEARTIFADTEAMTRSEELSTMISFLQDSMPEIKGILQVAGKQSSSLFGRTSISEIQDSAMKDRQKDPIAKGMTLTQANDVMKNKKQHNKKTVNAARTVVRASLDDIVTQYGFESTDDAETAIQDYYEKKQDIKEMQTDLKDARAKERSVARFLKNVEAVSGKAKAKNIQSMVEKISGMKDTSPKRTVTGTEKKLLTKKLKAEETVASKASQARGVAERAAAKRQVAVEKRETNRKLVRQRSDILSDIRDQNGTLAERKKRLLKYARENMSKKDVARVAARINDAKTARAEVKVFARMDAIIKETRKKEIRANIIKTVKRALSSPTVALEYKKKIASIIEHYELRGHSKGTMRKLENLRAFIDAKVADGEVVTMPTEVIDSMQALFRKPFDEISLREMTNINTKIEHLEKLGRLKRKLEMTKYENEVQTITEELTENVTAIEKNKKFEAKSGEPLTFGQRLHNHLIDALNTLRQIDYVLTPMDVLMDVLDGAKGTYDGAHMRMKAVIDNNFGWFLDLKDDLTGKVYKMANGAGLKEENFERMGIVAAREQDGGMEKLINTGYTEEEVNAIKLTKDERAVLDEMREVMDSQFPWVQAIMRDLYNTEVNKVKNYFSFMTDFASMEDMPMQQRFEDRATMDFTSPPKKTIAHKFAISRKGAGNQKIKVNAMQVFAKHIEDVAYFRAMAKDTKQFFEATNSIEYADKAGVLGQQFVVDWLDTIARKGGAEGANQIRFIDITRRNVSAGILGLKLSTIAIQPTALIDAMGMISPGKAMWGLEQITLNADARKYVLERFPELRDRTGGEVAIRELLEDSFWQKMQRRGFMPMQYVDKITAASAALGAYKAKMDELGLEVDYAVTPNAEAMAYAELVTRRTQASSLFKDLPQALSRGNLTGNRSIDRAILQFQTFLLYRWSRVRHDAIRVGISTKSPKQAVRVMTPIILASLAASGIRMGLREAMAALFGDDDNEDKEIADELARGMFYELSGTVPFVGQFWGTFMYGGGAFPIIDALQSVPEDMNSALFAKEPETRWRARARMLTGMTTLAGIPGSIQAQQISQDVMPRAGESGGKKKKEKKKKEKGKKEKKKKEKK